MKPGDVVRTEIGGIGVLGNPVPEQQRERDLFRERLT